MRQSPKRYPYLGDMLSLRVISELTGIPTETLRARLRYGIPLDKAFTDEDLRIVRCKGLAVIRVDYHGEELTLLELSERTGIKRATLATRYRFGDRGEQLWRPVENTNRGRKAYFGRDYF